MFFRITTSNFQEIILAVFRKFCRNKIKFYDKKQKKNCFVYYIYIFFKFFSTEFLKYIKEHFLKVLGIYLK